MWNRENTKRRARERKERIEAYHAENPSKSYAAIGREFNVSRERVRQLLTKKTSGSRY